VWPIFGNFSRRKYSVTDKLMSDFNDMLLDMECSGTLDPKYSVLLRVFLEMKRMKNQIKILEGKLENA
jgi:hypothetical protein